MTDVSAPAVTLSEFLLARIAEDEELAREAASRPGGDQCWETRVYDDGVRDPGVAIAPARVVAECEAKRRIVELHTGEHECVGDRHGSTGTVFVAPGYVHENDPTLRLLALPYADHPDYREEWRP